MLLQNLFIYFIAIQIVLHIIQEVIKDHNEVEVTIEEVERKVLYFLVWEDQIETEVVVVVVESLVG